MTGASLNKGSLVLPHCWVFLLFVVKTSAEPLTKCHSQEDLVGRRVITLDSFHHERDDHLLRQEHTRILYVNFLPLGNAFANAIIPMLPLIKESYAYRSVPKDACPQNLLVFPRTPSPRSSWPDKTKIWPTETQLCPSWYPHRKIIYDLNQHVICGADFFKVSIQASRKQDWKWEWFLLLLNIVTQSQKFWFLSFSNFALLEILVLKGGKPPSAYLWLHWIGSWDCRLPFWAFHATELTVDYQTCVLYSFVCFLKRF